MMTRLRQRHAHDAKRSGRGAQPCMMLHVDDDADSPAVLPHKLRISAMIFDLGRCVGTVAQLVLEPHQVDGVALPIGRDARREEAGKAFLRISERQEGIAHGRGAEPFMAGQPKSPPAAYGRSEEHKSELQSLMRSSDAV